MIALMLPCFLFAMYERDGLPFEKVLRNILRVKFLTPGIRPYRTNNFYAYLSEAGKEARSLETAKQSGTKKTACR